MTEFVSFSINAALVICVLLIVPCAYRVFVGPTIADRLLGIDAISNLLIGIIVLLALQQQQSLFFDVSILLAAVAFIGTLAATRFISEGRDF